MTTKPILLATDGSPSASEATLEAIELARAFGAPLLAVAVPHVSVPAYGYYGYADVLTELTKGETNHANEVLAETKKAADAAGIECETAAPDGPIVDEICAAARRHDARLIVIGAHGWGSVRRLIHGSISTGVLHQASCPVLVVRGGAELTMRAREAADQTVQV